MITTIPYLLLEICVESDVDHVSLVLVIGFLKNVMNLLLDVLDTFKKFDQSKHGRILPMMQWENPCQLGPLARV